MTHSSPAKTFILGVGASKCGTTWIQSYLNAAGHADFGRLGEYQIWDALRVPTAARFRVPRPSSLRRAEAAVAQALGRPIKADVFRYHLQSDPARYFAYFTDLLSRPGITLTGDITPMYAALPPDTLHEIDATFAARGIAVKTVLSLRDPIERAWSLIKMHHRKCRLGDRTVAEEFLERHGPGTTCLSHMTYRHPLETLAQVFPENRRFTTLYETLFTPETIQALSAFAGVPEDPDKGGQRVNAATDGSSVPPDLAREAFAHFAEDYAYCATHLPATRSLWPHAHLLD